LADVVSFAEGQIFIALPPDDWDWRTLEVDREAQSAAILSFPDGSSLTASQQQDENASYPPQDATSAHAGHRFPAQLTHMKQMLDGAPLYLAASYTYRGDDRARIAALAKLAERCATPLVVTGDV